MWLFKSIRKLLALVLLILFAPLLFIVSLIIFIDDGLPIFFRQKRVGRNNLIFIIYKFRTMKNGTPHISTEKFNSNENTYTKRGFFLRKFSIDEIPQIINVFRGEMNFIGPRPALFNQKDLINSRTELGIHSLKPGITGLAQVSGRDNLSLDKKIELDYFFLKNKSAIMCLKILFLTIIKVIWPKNTIKL